MVSRGECLGDASHLSQLLSQHVGRLIEIQLKVIPPNIDSTITKPPLEAHLFGSTIIESAVPTV